jgi:WD40 repeat protein
MRRLLRLGVALMVALAAFQVVGPSCLGQQPKAILKGQGDWVDGVAFSPDGRTIAAACQNGNVVLWEVLTGKVRATLRGHTAPVRTVAFGPRRTAVVSGSDDGTVQLWVLRMCKATAILRGHTAAVISTAFSPDGRHVASAGADGRVRLWAAATGKVTASLERQSPAVGSVTFSPDGTLLATPGWMDHAVRLYEAATGKQKAALQHHRALTFAGFSPDGRWLAGGDVTGNVVLWEVATGKKLRTLACPFDAPGVVNCCLAFSPDGNLLASCGRLSGDAGGKVWLWNVATGKHTATLLGHSDRVVSVAFSPDGNLLASAGWDGTVRLWDMATILKAKK